MDQSVTDTWIKDRADIEAGLVETFEKIFALDSDLAKRKSERTEAENRVSAIRKEQERITGIIRVLSSQDAAAQKYLDKLDVTETDLEVAREALEVADAQVREVEEKLKGIF